MSERFPRTESELVEHLRSLDVRAPQELHQRIDALVSERSPTRAGRARVGWRVGGALTVVAAAAVLVLALLGGSGSRMTMHEALALTLRAPGTLAPAPSAPDATRLAVAVDGVAFPSWRGLGWRSIGMSKAHLDGRSVTTVFYANGHGQRIGYAIVAGTPAPALRGGSVSWRNGTAYRVLVHGDSHVVSWQRAGHLCVVAGRGVAGARLLALASWQGSGAVSS